MTPLEQREKELAQLTVKSQAAQNLLSQHDSDILAEVCELSKGFRPGDGPDMAIFVLAQIKKVVEPIIQAHSTIQDYESKLKTVKGLRSRITQLGSGT